MPSPLSGPGQNLPFPQNLYPSQLNNAPYDSASNRVALAPGENLVLPAGDWYVSLGFYLVLQYLDPVNNIWINGTSASYNRGVHFIKSDGFTCRIANLTGCPFAAVVTSRGNTSYVQATTTVTVTGGGGSTWQPLIGGALSTTVSSVGAGYGVAPLCIIPTPQPPQANSNGVGGVSASGYAVIASGTVSTVSLTNPGAGYQTAPAAIALLPTPTDPNLSTGITLATCAFSLANAGQLTAVLCTNSGAPLSAPANITLAVSGAGATASCSAVVMQTVTAATVSGQGTGYGTTAGAVLTVGGVPSQGTVTNGPDFNYLAWLPRPANISLTPANTSVSVGTPAVVYDGGLFAGTPSAVWVNGGTGANTTVTLGTVALVMGSLPDIAVLQPAP